MPVYKCLSRVLISKVNAERERERGKEESESEVGVEVEVEGEWGGGVTVDAPLRNTRTALISSVEL